MIYTENVIDSYEEAKQQQNKQKPTNVFFISITAGYFKPTRSYLLLTTLCYTYLFLQLLGVSIIHRNNLEKFLIFLGFR